MRTSRFAMTSGIATVLMTAALIGAVVAPVGAQSGTEPEATTYTAFARDASKDVNGLGNQIGQESGLWSDGRDILDNRVVSLALGGIRPWHRCPPQ